MSWKSDGKTRIVTSLYLRPSLFLVVLPKLNLELLMIREKFSPGPGFEPGSLALRAGALINRATQTIQWAKLEFSY